MIKARTLKLEVLSLAGEPKPKEKFYAFPSASQLYQAVQNNGHVVLRPDLSLVTTDQYTMAMAVVDFEYKEAKLRGK